jgi:hypothetical protein
LSFRKHIIRVWHAVDVTIGGGEAYMSSGPPNLRVMAFQPRESKNEPVVSDRGDVQHNLLLM